MTSREKGGEGVSKNDKVLSELASTVRDYMMPKDDGRNEKVKRGNGGV